jgi:hypothetical protein
MMVRVHGRQLGGMTCVDILAAESGGKVGLNRSVAGWDDRDMQEMYW